MNIFVRFILFSSAALSPQVISLMQQSFYNSSQKAAHEAHLTFELFQILLSPFHLGRGFYGHVTLEKGAYLRFIPFSLGLLVYCQVLSSPHCLVWSEQWFGVNQGTSNQSTSSKHNVGRRVTEGNGKVKSFILIVAGFIPITLTHILGINPGDFCCLLT